MNKRHGRDHRPDGSDPIPGIAGTSGPSYGLVLNANIAFPSPTSDPFGSVQYSIPRTDGSDIVSASGVWHLESGSFFQAGIQSTDPEARSGVLIGAWIQTIGSDDREIINGDSFAIAASGGGVVTFDNHVAESTLLDLTNPAEPVVTATGVYAFSISVLISDP